MSRATLIFCYVAVAFACTSIVLAAWLLRPSDYEIRLIDNGLPFPHKVYLIRINKETGETQRLYPNFAQPSPASTGEFGFKSDPVSSQ